MQTDENKTKQALFNAKSAELIKQLTDQDTPKHLISNLTDIFVGYNGSEYSDCVTERQSKSNTFVILLEFLGGLSTLKSNK